MMNINPHGRTLAGMILGLTCLASLASAQTYDSYVWQFPQVTNISSSADWMKAVLRNEVQKVLDAGHLAPLYQGRGDSPGYNYYLYWERSRIVTTLAWAYPYLTAAQQTAVQTYVRNELATAAYAPWNTNPKNLAPMVGARREYSGPTQAWYWDGFWNGIKTARTRPCISTLYGVWLYAYRSGDWTVVDNNWNAIKSYYSTSSGEANIYGTMCAHIAMARMAQHRNDTATMNTAITNLTTAFNDGKTFTTIDNRCKNSYYSWWYNDARTAPSTYHGFAFLNLSPEVGRYLKDYVASDVLARTDVGKAQFPAWWVLSADYETDWFGIEGSGLTSEMAGMIFPVEKWVRAASADTLAGWMKSAPEGKGDCYWLENLVLAIEAYGTTTWTDIRNTTAVTGRSIFYNNSAWDGNDPAANVADDAAIASDKSALLPGQTATFANYTSYSKGINGVMVDIVGLPGTPSAADFSFRMGNSNDPRTWRPAPAPVSITVQAGAGVGSASRVTIVWADHAIQKQWLQVVVLPTAATGLSSADVFYWGNAIGQSGDATTDAKVTAMAEINARHNPHSALNPASITNRYDYDRDKKVNATDQIIARNNITTSQTALQLITAPAAGDQ